MAGLTLLCTTLGENWAKQNLWRAIEVNCAKSHERLVSNKEDVTVEQASGKFFRGRSALLIWVHSACKLENVLF